MYYEPKYFIPQEFFSELIYNKEEKVKSGNKIWRLMDGRILWTADKIRDRFFCITKNNSFYMIIIIWFWGGNCHLRGYRDIYVDIIEPNQKIFSVSSQHCFGRALDYSFEHISAKEVVADILNNPDIDAYKFITGLEMNTSWVHSDVRSWNKFNTGILTFGR